ncbi:MAG: ABC transporter ATP-binding protein [Anaerolineales bacterium]|nr:ABC transporter ATP-binding protein [Anaerolineales bacterium]
MSKITPPAYVIKAEEEYSKGYDPRIARKIMEIVHPYGARLFLALVLMIITSAASVSGPYFVKIAIDSGLASANLTVLRNTLLLYLLISAIQWASIYLRVRVMSRVGQHVLYDTRTKLFEHLQKLSLSFYTHFSAGRVFTRVINDVGVLRQFITWDLLAIVRDILMLVGVMIAMLSMNLRLSLIAFSVLPLMIAATTYFRYLARQAYRRVRAAISWVNSVLAENVNGVRVVQAFSRQEHNYRNFRDYVNRYRLETTLKTIRIASLFFPVVDILRAIATALVVWVGGTAVLGEKITAGILVAFVLYIDRFFDPIRDLSRRFDSLQSTMAGGERILELLNTEVEVQDARDAYDLPPIQGEVVFDNVSFHYRDDPTQVLKDVNLHVQPGETIALVGETGAGKTTLVKLVLRFYDPTEGTITIDNHDLRKVTQASLRKQMGVVLQDPFLFDGTVRENIHFGRLNATDEEIEAAAKAVGAHEFITGLRNGYDTEVEEGGALLSVGQRQLISFARALLADPNILILDEATSSVDTQTEQIIQTALTRLLKGRTSFVIAHRLSTIIHANRILVIHDGQIVEEGSHLSLLEQKGLYYELYRTTFAG